MNINPKKQARRDLMKKLGIKTVKAFQKFAKRERRRLREKFGESQTINQTKESA